jgi:5-methylthioadenosine/S-adenosylhomocysteine deaminase
MKILLKNAEIITLNETNEVLENSCIGIIENKINYIGTFCKELEEKYDKIIDCTDKVVMPGFVNAHNHASMTMFRNYADDLKLMEWLFEKIFPLEDKLTPEQADWASKLAVIEMIKSGTTTFSDMYFFMDKTAEVVAKSGIRAALSRGLQGEEGQGIDLRIQENIDLYRRYNESYSGRIKVMFGPHSVFTCSEGYLKNISNLSKEMNIPIQIHLSETRDEVKNCIDKYGISPVKLLDKLGILSESLVAAHCVMVDDEDINILAEKKVNVVHNPGSNLKLASGIAPIVKMIDKGINVCLGTDGAASNNNLDMLEEIRMATYMQKVQRKDPTALPVDTVLKMATVNGAKALGFNNLGSAQVGMIADLIIIDTKKSYYYPKYNIKSAIVYSGNASDVESVIINGELIMENGVILTLDEEKVLSEASKYMCF